MDKFSWTYSMLIKYFVYNKSSHVTCLKPFLVLLMVLVLTRVDNGPFNKQML